ncbi:hypothetical protein CXB51_021450 [Gossypium anomalum]|uniref:Zinc finger A20 and AN1 domain-containing stress-associated protein 5 n=1 Tax=Gossypium anomalum TaxID=47600 RepID=A0A8J6CWQ4_9ROSI|nr:hypothetical protein CXB51_021450 [Gossypium anomalum]
MAQRTEKEETEFKVPETLTLCVNDCGVIGNPATNNMCQNCFNATTPKSTAAVVSSSTGGTSSAGVSILNQRSTTSRSINKRSDLSPPKTTTFVRSSGSRNDPEPGTEKKVVNRCSGCRKRVGLTGFRCRCGELFCADHRYSDRHDCSYDYKTVGREAIARENPVVKAAKIIKV